MKVRTHEYNDTLLLNIAEHYKHGNGAQYCHNYKVSDAGNIDLHYDTLNREIFHYAVQFIYDSTEPFVGPCLLFQFLDFYAVSMTLSTGDQPVARPLHIHRTAQTQNKRTQTYMSQLGFEPTIPAFQWTKMVHALVSAACCIITDL
jgi:hypothetical protein